MVREAFEQVGFEGAVAEHDPNALFAAGLSRGDWDVFREQPMSEDAAGLRAPVYLDMTRLLRRAAKATLSGIDRIHIAYATRFLAEHGSVVRFVAAFGGRPRIIPTEAARRFIATVEATWRSHIDPVALRSLPRLASMIGVPLPDLLRGPPPARDKRVIAAARLFCKTMLAGLGGRTTPPLSPADQAVYLNLSHETFLPSAMRGWFAAAGIRAAIFFVHDLIPITHPEFFDPGDDERHARRLQAIASIASTVLVNSDFTKNELREFIRARRLKEIDIEVMPFGIGDAFLAPPAAPRSSISYFVCLGIIEPRKNHVTLLQAWRRLAALAGQETPKLVLVGARGTGIQNVVALLDRSREIGSHVIECGPLPDAILAVLMAGARAVLFPSIVEGFGLPILESLSLGTPVICSDIAPFRQVAGGVAEFLDPLDGLAWLDAVMDYALAASPRHAAQRARIARFRPPRWDEHFARLEGILDRLRRAAAPAPS